MGCHFLLQEIFLTQGSHLCLLHWQADSLPLSPKGTHGVYIKPFSEIIPCLCPLLTLLSVQSRFYNLWVQCKMQGPSWEWGISLPSYGPPPAQPTGRWANPKRGQPRRSWVPALRVSEGPLLSRPAMCRGTASPGQ